ncbi:MAG TPA: HNH endonuclease signature motif containing protein [Actinomycetes bacterium]|nr:HNH endonuclease signature motif containing protein [Actinomycetes bacterium]
MKPAADRLWAKVDKSAGPDGCWPFTGSTMHNGYGHLGAGRRGDPTVAAHRVAYESAVGPIPAGMNVLHTCDNRPCCNPAHLWIGTQRDNLLDMVAKGRHGMTVKAARRRASEEWTESELRAAWGDR